MGIAMHSDGPVEGWALNVGDNGVFLLLSEAEMQASDIIGKSLLDQSLAVTLIAADTAIPDDVRDQAKAVILEVKPDMAASMQRLKALRDARPGLPIVAAVRDANIPAVRGLLHCGVSDVIALPLVTCELQAVLAEIRENLASQRAKDAHCGHLVSVIKSVGGVGATMLATQAASLEARIGREKGRQTCLFDLDLQFGNAGTYLGVTSPLTLADLLHAGNRVDADLLRSVTTQAPGGLYVVTAPNDIIPMEAVNAEQVYRIIDLALQEFDSVYLDLPGNWTNWSLSLVARSQVVLLVVELTIASLRQARRQIALLKDQDIPADRIHVVANRVEKKLFRTIGLGEAEEALGHPVRFSIANDFPLVNSALDQGLLIEDLRAKSRVSRDIHTLLDDCIATTTQEEK